LTESKKVIIGSRGSRLAVLQAKFVLNKLEQAYPDIEFSLSRITTTGDHNPETPLERMGEEGVFVKELEQALLRNQIDIAVHSLKDMPTDMAPALVLAAVPQREDARDVLITASGRSLAELAPGSSIGTGSARRAVELLSQRPDLDVRTLRGNVDTRLRKITSGELDGAIMAAAALIRLGWQERVTEYLSVEQFLPAVGQGALGIETKADDSYIIKLVSKLDHQPSHAGILAERAFLKALGGGCRAPIAALGVVSGNSLELKGMVAGVNSRHFLRGQDKGTISSAEEIGQRLAHSLLEKGATKLIAEAKA